MTTEEFGRRLSRRLLSPVELLYDITRHWFLIVCAVGIGTVIMIAQVTSEPSVFECAATLLLSPNEIHFDPAERRMARDGDQASFIVEQLSLLQSDSVIEKVAKQIGYDSILLQEARPRQEPGKEEDEGVVQKTYHKIKAYFVALNEMLKPRVVGTELERKKEIAKALFRARSFVMTERRSNIVKIGIRGTQYSRLEEELGAWIEAYRVRIDEISRESYERLFNERTDVWVKAEKEAQQNLDKFRVENPGVTQARQEMSRERVLRLKIALDQAQLDLGGPQGPGTAAVRLPPLNEPITAHEREGDLLTRLRIQKSVLEVERALLRSKVPPTSTKLQNVEDQIKSIDQEILKAQVSLGSGSPALAPVPGGEDGIVASKRIDLISAQLNKAIEEQAILDEKLEELKKLTEEKTRVAEVLRRLQALREGKIEQTESRKIVDVKVQDKPVASLTPIGGSYFKIGLGTAFGGSVGLFLSFLLELFSQKVRFKRDLENDLGLKVIGVIRKN